MLPKTSLLAEILLGVIKLDEYNVIVQHTGDNGLTVSDCYILGPDFSTVEQAKEYAMENIVGPRENGFCAFCWIAKYEGFENGKPLFIEVESLW